MNINKFTLAAALSIGIMASTTYAGLTQDLAVDTTSQNVVAACPCQTPITPQTAKCPTCLKDKSECCCPAPCDPCAKKDPCCDPCEKKDPCPCPPMAACPCPSDPACAVCPSTTCSCDKFEQQVYAYPNAIYGTNNIIGERKSSVVVGVANLNDAYGTAPTLTCGCGDITGAAAEIPTMGMPILGGGSCGCRGIAVSAPACGCGCPTGAASSMPILGQNCGCQGIPVDRSCGNIEGAGCPVQIHTNTSMEALKKTLSPFQVETPTGAAVPLISAFEDVPSGFWAGCEINKLTSNNVIAGYPDRTFKPNLPVSRAEMATLIVKGFNLNDKLSCAEKTFKDVSKHHWANKTINRAVGNGLMAGYPNDYFKPGQPVSRAEALTILSKGINCPMDECKAQQILSQYCDASTVPSWAAVPIAKSLEAGANTNSPQPNVIAPNKDASRAEIASMLENVRVAIGYSKTDKPACADGAGACGCPTGCATYMEKQEVIQIPTLQLCFADEISAKSANVGDQFAAKTIDEVTIDGKCFPAGSRVNGKVMEVVRPTKDCHGALRLSFNTIESSCDKCKTALPNQILTAQVNKVKTPNAFIRVLQAPFTWTGGIIGNAGRTLGGAIVSLSNAAEQVVSGTGVATSELFTGQFRAAGRSYQDVGKAIVKAPVDLTRTALSGTVGTFQYTGDEISYLVDPKGMKVSSVNPKEKITIAFGCQSQ